MMDKFEFTNIYTRESDEESDLQVASVNKKQPKSALIYSLFDLYFVSVLDANFKTFEEFKSEKGGSFSGTITGCRNIEAPEDMLLIKLANHDFIQLKWMEGETPEDVIQGLRIITEAYKSIKGPGGKSVYDSIQSIYDKGDDCMVSDLRL
jgi:hypothetical protein